MKILLIIPPTDLDKSYGSLKSFSNPQPSLGIAYIGAFLIQNSYDVKVIDAYVNSYTLEVIIDEIKKYDPDIVGISVLTPSAEVVYEISRHIRKELPKAKIVMGNLHATLFCNEVLSDNYADIVVHGEGEITMVEIVSALEAQDDFGKIMGISFKKDGDIIHNPPRPLMEDLDALPFPEWNLFPMDRYSTDPRTSVKAKVSEMSILATRGCPNECTFCSSRTERSLGGRYRMRDPKKVVDEMVYMNKKYGSEVFAFMDLAFPLVKKHAMELCNEIIDRGYNKKFKWMSECRVKPLDEELLTTMKRAGCVRINFGIESANDDILKMLKKNFTVEDVRRAVKMTQDANIVVDGMFMIGLPGENEITIKRTIDFAIELGIRYAIFNIFVPYPGCELYDKLMAEKKIHFKSWSDFISYPTYAGGVPVYVPEDLTCDKLMQLQKYAMKRFYLRPKFIFNELKNMKLSHIKNYYEGFKALFS